jgi:hypothetical protein
VFCGRAVHSLRQARIAQFGVKLSEPSPRPAPFQVSQALGKRYVAAQPGQAAVQEGFHLVGLETLGQAAGVRVWRTDRQGSLVWRAEGAGTLLFPLNTYLPVVRRPGPPP